MAKCARHHSQYVYHASAYGFAGEFERPVKHSIPTQAAAVLAPSGGRGSVRVHGFKYDGVISVEDAYSEVGGSYDDCHDIYTTYAFSVLEGINVADVLTADRIVSRLSIYAHNDSKKEPSFDITGSHFENLKIAGHKVDVKLATHVFHDYDTYSKITNADKEWLLGSKLGGLKDRELDELENTYHALAGMADLAKTWKNKGKRPDDAGTYQFSPANHLKLEEHVGTGSEVKGYGNIVCIPKFGVVRLAELVVHKHSRNLTMFRVQMCSAGSGGTDGAGAGGSGGTPSGG